MALSLAPVECLSDESSAGSGRDSEAEADHCAPLQEPSKKASTALTTPLHKLTPIELRSKLLAVVGSLCHCSRMRKHDRQQKNCFLPFRTSFEPLLQLLVRLNKLHKQDMDNEVSFMH